MPTIDEHKDAGDLYESRGDVSIELHTGEIFNILEPTFEIESIAHSLAQNARFNGHLTEFYSVAQHSLLVAYLMDEVVGGDPLEGLLHDGTEAYLSDVPAPLKQLLPDWKKLDHKLEEQLREHFGVGPKTEECKLADWIALFIEGYHLLPSRAEWFTAPEGVYAQAQEVIRTYDLAGEGFVPLDWEFAKAAYLQAFDFYAAGGRLRELG